MRILRRDPSSPSHKQHLQMEIEDRGQKTSGIVDLRRRYGLDFFFFFNFSRSDSSCQQRK